MALAPRLYDIAAGQIAAVLTDDEYEISQDSGDFDDAAAQAVEDSTHALFQLPEKARAAGLRLSRNIRESADA